MRWDYKHPVKILYTGTQFRTWIKFDPSDDKQKVRHAVIIQRHTLKIKLKLKLKVYREKIEKSLLFSIAFQILFGNIFYFNHSSLLLMRKIYITTYYLYYHYTKRLIFLNPVLFSHGRFFPYSLLRKIND